MISALYYSEQKITIHGIPEAAQCAKAMIMEIMERPDLVGTDASKKDNQNQTDLAASCSSNISSVPAGKKPGRGGRPKGSKTKIVKLDKTLYGGDILSVENEISIR